MTESYLRVHHYNDSVNTELGAVVSEVSGYLWIYMDPTSFSFRCVNNLHKKELEERHEEWSSDQIIFRNSVIKELGSFVGGVEARDTRIVANCSAPLINWFFSHSRSLLNATQSTSDEGYLCATDKESFSTGKRCFLVAFTDGVGEKERNSTKSAILNLQGLCYLLARRFYICDCLPFLFL